MVKIITLAMVLFSYFKCTVSLKILTQIRLHSERVVVYNKELREKRIDPLFI